MRFVRRKYNCKRGGRDQDLNGREYVGISKRHEHERRDPNKQQVKGHMLLLSRARAIENPERSVDDEAVDQDVEERCTKSQIGLESDESRLFDCPRDADKPGTGE